MSNLFDKTTQGLGVAMNMRLLRQNLTSSNIANAETPGYRAKKVDFEEALARAMDLDGKGKMEATHSQHFRGALPLSRIRADVYDNPEINTTNDSNTVDLEREMAQLAENGILYKAAVSLMNKKLAALKYAVTEGGR